MEQNMAGLKVGEQGIAAPGVTVREILGEKHSPHALDCLCLLARLHHIAADPGTLAHQLGLAPSEALTQFDLMRAAKHLGLKAKITRTTPDRLNLAPLSALVRLPNPNPTAANTHQPKRIS